MTSTFRLPLVRLTAIIPVFIFTFLVTGPVVAQQESNPDPSIISASVILVLEPEFCQSVTKKKNSLGLIASKKLVEQYENHMCDEIEAMISRTYDASAVQNQPPETVDSEIVLHPEVVDATTDSRFWAGQEQESVLVIEWTATDSAGDMLWIESIEGVARSKAGNAFKRKEVNRKRFEALISDVLEKSQSAFKKWGRTGL